MLELNTALPTRDFPMPHLVHDIPYRNPTSEKFQMVVEIPAGTNEKWTTDADSGVLYHEQMDGKPRMIRFLSYPFNYGFIPQTFLSKAQGGDGDPLDVVLVASALPRESVQTIEVLGAFKLIDRGELDTKVIAVLADGPFSDLTNLTDMQHRYPGMLEMLRLWFDSYKGLGAFTFQGEADKAETISIIEAHHQGWLGAQTF